MNPGNNWLEMARWLPMLRRHSRNDIMMGIRECWFDKQSFLWRPQLHFEQHFEQVGFCNCDLRHDFSHMSHSLTFHSPKQKNKNWERYSNRDSHPPMHTQLDLVRDTYCLG